MTSIKLEEDDYRERLSKSSGAVFSQTSLESTRSFHTLMLVNALLQLGEPDEARRLFQLVDAPQSVFTSAYTDYQRHYEAARKLLMPE